ncbi:hypothetical protein [Brevundimonas sp.]|uniref:hypothetical protein n=1 Tax=Brevundimonas sp. TaxID=1871086 RepID=UPI003BAA8C77
MSDHPDDPHEAAVAPFPAAIGPSPFPPLDGDQAAQLTDPADPSSDWNQAADAHDLSFAHESQRQNRLVALSRFAFPPEPWPDDEAVAARDRRWTSRAIMVTTVFLLIFNAVSIQNWSRQQAPGWVTSTVQQLSDVWSAQIAQLGADQPRQGVREAYQAAQAQQLPGQAPGAGPSEAAR